MPAQRLGAGRLLWARSGCSNSPLVACNAGCNRVAKHITPRYIAALFDRSPRVSERSCNESKSVGKKENGVLGLWRGTAIE